MKTKIFGGIAIVAIALAVAFNVSLNTSKTNNASVLALANVDAFAQGEIGPPLTNWKETTFECERTVGINYGVVYTTTTKYTKVGCGYGSGWCLSAAGC